MATRKITVKASDLNKDAPTYLEREDGTLTVYRHEVYGTNTLETVEHSKSITDAMMRRAMMSMREIERAVVKSMYSHDNPGQIVIEPPNYQLAPGAVGIGQMVDLQGVS